MYSASPESAALELPDALELADALAEEDAEETDRSIDAEDAADEAESEAADEAEGESDEAEADSEAAADEPLDAAPLEDDPPHATSPSIAANAQHMNPIAKLFFITVALLACPLPCKPIVPPPTPVTSTEASRVALAPPTDGVVRFCLSCHIIQGSAFLGFIHRALVAECV